jgi:hypothetical protein
MNGNQSTQFEGSLAFELGKYVGRIETQLEYFAGSVGLSAPQLTHRVATLLLSGAGREALRLENPVSPLRRSSTAGNKPVRALEMASGPSGATPKVRAHGGPKQYWAKMTPEQRRNEMKRRRANGLGHPTSAAQKTSKLRESNLAYWAKMTPEQKKKEMARRVAKRKLGKASLVTQTKEKREARAQGAIG